MCHRFFGQKLHFEINFHQAITVGLDYCRCHGVFTPLRMFGLKPSIGGKNGTAICKDGAVIVGDLHLEGSIVCNSQAACAASALLDYERN
jgi:hypothetical protein